MEKRIDALTAQKSCLYIVQKFSELWSLDFGPLTSEFTVMVWRPFMRQMGEIGETRSILGTHIRQSMAGTAERICTKFTRKTCLVLCSDELECQSQKSKVRQGHQGQKTRCALTTPTVWNGLVADNFA